jgi:hypothetical protein
MLLKQEKGQICFIKSVKQFCYWLTKCLVGTTELELKLKQIMHYIHHELCKTRQTELHTCTLDQRNDHTFHIQNVQQALDYRHAD